jgi:hypothetical protein
LQGKICRLIVGERNSSIAIVHGRPGQIFGLKARGRVFVTKCPLLSEGTGLLLLGIRINIRGRFNGLLNDFSGTSFQDPMTEQGLKL